MGSPRFDADHDDARSLGLAEAEAIVAEADFHRIAQRSEADDFNFLAFEQAHFHDPLDERVVALDRFDPSEFAGKQMIERRHRTNP